MKEWKLVNIVLDGQPIRVGGLNPWEHEWQSETEAEIRVSHPSHPSEIHKMRIYRIESQGKSVIFAAGEFSNCVWGFYV